MEKKFKFSDNPTVAKSIYGAVIALLCITAIVIGIVAANSRKKDVTDEQPPVVDDGSGDQTGDGSGDENTNGEGNQNGDNGDGKDEGNGNSSGAVTFISPVSGKVMTEHSTTTPVYSATLEEWRIHTGIDIMTEVDAEVFAAAAGEVTKVYSAPLLGKTVEITHENGVKTVYSNLSAEGLPTVGTTVAAGEKIGTVGDSAIIEIAEEAHLHFEMLVNDASVNPLDYLSEDSKRVSLGITDEKNEEAA